MTYITNETLEGIDAVPFIRGQFRMDDTCSKVVQVDHAEKDTFAGLYIQKRTWQGDWQKLDFPYVLSDDYHAGVQLPSPCISENRIVLTPLINLIHDAKSQYFHGAVVGFNLFRGERNDQKIIVPRQVYEEYLQKNQELLEIIKKICASANISFRQNVNLQQK